MQGRHLRERRSSLPVVSMLPSLEMELLKCNHWNTLKPGILWCWDWSLCQKEKDLKIILLYIISETKVSQEHPSFEQLEMKKAHLSNAEPPCCCCWVLGTNSPFSPQQGCAEIYKTHPLLFLFPCTKFFSFVACESTCKNDSRAHSSLLNWEPN